MALLIAAHQPAEPSARAISSTASNSSTPVPPSPPSASGRRIENKIGVEHDCCNAVRESPKALRRERFRIDQAADRLCPIEGTRVRDGRFAEHRGGMLTGRMNHGTP